MLVDQGQADQLMISDTFSALEDTQGGLSSLAQVGLDGGISLDFLLPG